MARPLPARRAQTPGEPRAERPRRAARGDTREALIRCGTELCSERGFQVTGIDEVLKRVGVPKGSFYHFFETKRQFGQAVIQNYATYFQRRLDATFGDKTQPPLVRLREFVEQAERGMARFHYQRGCLVGNMGQELGGLDEDFRKQLEDVLLSWQAATADCLRDAAEQRQLPAGADPERLAAFFWIGWEGAILRAKLTRNAEPMRLFADLFFELLGKKRDDL
jgi:TetR/AcrR family transcriptional repressor of nem operon